MPDQRQWVMPDWSRVRSAFEPMYPPPDRCYHLSIFVLMLGTILTFSTHWPWIALSAFGLLGIVLRRSRQMRRFYAEVDEAAGDVEGETLSRRDEVEVAHVASRRDGGWGG